MLYTGYTTNIVARLQHHNEGRTKSTSSRRPLELIFCEFYLFAADARKREMYVKTTAGKKAIKLMLGETLRKLGYKGAAGVAVVEESEEADSDVKSLALGLSNVASPV